MRLIRRALAVLLLLACSPTGAQFANGFEGAAPPPPAPVDPCAGDPLIKPAGYIRTEVSWERMFSGHSFPRMPSWLQPVGAWTLRTTHNTGPRMIGRYLTVPFVPQPGQSYRIAWLNAQAVGPAGYGNPRPADRVLVSISECSGDLRKPSLFSPDPQISQCRGLNNSGVLSFGTAPSSLCKLQPGRTYWLNVVFADPAGGLSPTETTCTAGRDRCEANFRP